MKVSLPGLLFFILLFAVKLRAEEFRDPHSFARPEEAVVEHIDLDLEVDMKKREISGKAKLRIRNLKKTRRFYLDTHGLSIEKVTHGEKEVGTDFELGEPVNYLGQQLTIKILRDTKLVTVYYRTTANADALQWLGPAQTKGGKPFLFTQSQAILARTWIPCQDTPAVRITYTARIKVPPTLQAVMSAAGNAKQKNANGVYEFQMDQPIPSYLIALAVGDLAFRPIGDRTGVYAEPVDVEKAAWEFADAEKMLRAAEKLFGRYQWGRYDLIVLPPSFPFGGMENPRLTFATPTILAGDRSLVSLIAHELAHSWSGNLVTNATWNDFWLNEGFTEYIQQRISEEVYGKDFVDMQAVLMRKGLLDLIASLPENSPETHLKLNLKGRNPDDGVSPIAYDKGYFFLRTIEEAVGRKKFDTFLKKYFQKFAFKSLTTETFLQFLRDNLLKNEKALERKLQIEDWVYGPGVPSNMPKLKSTMLAEVDEELKEWIAGKPAKELEVNDWVTQQWMHFTGNLPQQMSQAQMADLDRAFHFSTTGNSEVKFRWLRHVVLNHYEPAYASLDSFLTGMGRLKFLAPLYGDMAKSPEGTQRAKRIYKKARAGYHPVAQAAIDKILNWQGL